MLIVEDDKYSSLYFETLIGDLFKEIIYVESGFDAIDICKKNSEIDIILMDIKLPGINGVDTIKVIREFNKDVIIIAQTAYTESEYKSAVFEVGCNAYLTKPIKKEVLFEEINKILKG